VIAPGEADSDRSSASDEAAHHPGQPIKDDAARRAFRAAPRHGPFADPRRKKATPDDEPSVEAPSVERMDENFSAAGGCQGSRPPEAAALRAVLDSPLPPKHEASMRSMDDSAACWAKIQADADRNVGRSRWQFAHAGPDAE
jgi:hypothetical protein